MPWDASGVFRTGKADARLADIPRSDPLRPPFTCLLAHALDADAVAATDRTIRRRNVVAECRGRVASIDGARVRVVAGLGLADALAVDASIAGGASAAVFARVAALRGRIGAVAGHRVAHVKGARLSVCTRPRRSRCALAGLAGVEHGAEVAVLALSAVDGLECAQACLDVAAVGGAGRGAEHVLRRPALLRRAAALRPL